MENSSFEDILSSITSNEGLMERIGNIVKNNKSGEITDTLPEVLAAISPNLGSQAATNGSRSAVDDPQPVRNDSASVSTEQDMPVEGRPMTKGRGASSSAVLLRALKPYLSHERAEMVDTIIKISQIAELLRLSR